MTTTDANVLDTLNAVFPMCDGQVDYRFEVRPRSSIYIRKAEHRRGENRARIKITSARNFPNAFELHTYIDNSNIQTDHRERDYLIGAEHIEEIINILRMAH